MPRHCYVLRVFTRDGEGGNRLGVVTDILGLDDQKMQRIASDLGFSETIFLRWFDEPHPHSRIFTPTVEMPFAGHPLVGAAWLLINLGPVNPGAIDCGVGTIRISGDETNTWIEVDGGQRVIPAITDLGGWVSATATAVVEMPSPYLLVEVSAPEVVKGVAAPEEVGGHQSIYLWSWIKERERVKARFFNPGMGIVEDPATGSAAVALAAHLRDRGQPEGEILIEQGAEIGHPSLLRLRWNETVTSLGGEVASDEVLFLKT